MIQPIESLHRNTVDGNPAGGYCVSEGLTIKWQDGPLGRGEERTEPNGAFVETVVFAAIDRLVYFQDSRHHCLANAIAIGHLRAALEVLKERTRDREDRGVEGTHRR